MDFSPSTYAFHETWNAFHAAVALAVVDVAVLTLVVVVDVVESAPATAGMLKPVAAMIATAAKDLMLTLFMSSPFKNRIDCRKRNCERGVRTLLDYWEMAVSCLGMDSTRLEYVKTSRRIDCAELTRTEIPRSVESKDGDLTHATRTVGECPWRRSRETPVTTERRPRVTSAALETLRSAGSHPVVRGFPEGAIVVFDDELRYLCAGGDGLAIVGLSQEDIEGKTIFEIFPRGVSTVLEPAYREALDGVESTLDIEFGGRTFLHRIAPLRDDEAEIVGGIGFALDVSASREAERALRESERTLRDERRRLRDAEDIGHAGSWEWDIASDVITWSDGLFDLHGLARVDFTEGYAQAASKVHPDDREVVDAAMETCRQGESVHFRYRVARAGDGQMRWFDSHASGVLEGGTLIRLVGAVADVTEQVLAEADVIEANSFLTAVLLASPDYTFITDVRTGAMVYGSKDRDLLGRTTKETEKIGGEAIATLVHPDDQAAIRSLNQSAESAQDGEVLAIRLRLRHADGSWRWMSRHVVPFRRDSSGKVIEVLGVMRDVTEVVRAEERLFHDALHDELTGLPNRSLLLDRMVEALARSVRDRREISVLFCDLDGFKTVNDTAGHATGDALLIEVAHRLRNTLREGDTVARVGGDEFVLIVEPWNRPNNDATIGGREDANAGTLGVEVARRVIKAMNVPFTINGVDFAVTVSVGVTYGSLISSHALGPDRASEIIAEADKAMYRAKREGKNQFRVHGADEA
jgi:diguanylate cyclase (GGDEF)-like protein/PAS domain S-box-containing protein